MEIRKSHVAFAAAVVAAFAAGVAGAETFEQTAANALKDSGLKAQFTALKDNIPAEPVMSVDPAGETNEATTDEVEAEDFAAQHGGHGGGHPGGGHPGNPGHPGHPGNPGHPGGGHHGPDRDPGRHGDGHRGPIHEPGRRWPHNEWGRWGWHHGWGGYWGPRGYYWGWGPYGYPLWWGWTIWYPAYGSCWNYYERQYYQCTEAAQVEYDYCVSECRGYGDCVAQCGTNLNYARLGCEESRHDNERFYCR